VSGESGRRFSVGDRRRSSWDRSRFGPLLVGLLVRVRSVGLPRLVVLCFARNIIRAGDPSPNQTRTWSRCTRLVRQDTRDLFFERSLRVGRRWMRREYFGDRARAGALVHLDALEEGYKRLWGRIRLCTCTASQEIGFTLGVAAELQIRQRNRDVQAFVQIRTQPILPTQQHQRIVAILHELAIRGVPCAVAPRDVEISCAITPASSDSSCARRIKPAVDIEKSARQRERIHFVRESITLMVKGTRASELRTRFCPTRSRTRSPLDRRSAWKNAPLLVRALAQRDFRAPENRD